MVRFSIEEKNTSFYQGLKLKLIFGIAAFIILFMFADIIADLYQKPISLIIRIASFSFLLTPFIESLKSSSIGLKNVRNFNFLSIIYQFCLIIFLLVLFFLFGKKSVYAALAFLLANFFTFLFSLRGISFKLFFSSNNGDIKNRINKYIKDGFIYGLTKNIYFQCPFIIGAYFVDSIHLAYYSFGLSIGIQGLFTFITAIQTMLLPYIINIKSKTTLSKYVSLVMKTGIFISVILSLWLLLITYFLLPWLFPNYIEAFKYFPWIFLAFVFVNLRTPISLFKAAERMDLLTKLSLMATLFSVIISLILSFALGLTGMVIALNLNVLLYSYLHIHYLKKLKGIKINLFPVRSDWIILKKYFFILLSTLKTKFFSYLY